MFEFMSEIRSSRTKKVILRPLLLSRRLSQEIRLFNIKNMFRIIQLVHVKGIFQLLVR